MLARNYGSFRSIYFFVIVGMDKGKKKKKKEGRLEKSRDYVSCTKKRRFDEGG